MSSESIHLLSAIGKENPFHQLKKPFHELLSGQKAFYNQPDYLEAAKRDFSRIKPLPTTYNWNTEHKIFRIAKLILSILIFPIGIYNLLHSLIGKVAVLRAATPHLLGYQKKHADIRRSQISLDGEWKYKRMTIQVDGYKIDAMIVGKTSTLGNGRWMLASHGNCEYYEELVSIRHDFKRIFSAVNSNAILFNYPGVGASTGNPSRQAMVKAYRGVLSFLEDKQNGVNAKEIIGYGHSIGAGVQGEALETHTLKNEIKYLFVKKQTFSDLSKVATSYTNSKLVGFLVKFFGWNINPLTSSMQLQAPEIIMQTANIHWYEEIIDSSQIIDDGVIVARASLAKAMLENNKCARKNKVFIGMKESHNIGLINPEFLAKRINAFLK